MRVPRYTIRLLMVGTLLIAVVICGGIYFWPSRDVQGNASAVELDTKIQDALRDGKIVLVLVTAKWSIQSTLVKDRIVGDSRVGRLVNDGSVIILESDITAPGTRLPKSVEAGAGDNWLPVVFVLSSSRDDPLVVKGKTISVDRVLTAITTVLKEEE